MRRERQSRRAGRIARLVSVLLALAVLAALLPTSALAAEDWDVPGGHFFTQTGGGAGKGYLVSDEGGVRFWSEFQRLGGVRAVGYPASQRFAWDGFTVQVFQRVIFQWRPESGSVAFVNVFDRLSELGKDAWLLQARQTPRPVQLDERGKSWEQVVAGRLALLDVAPAIRAKYYDVVGDPIQANGLPTSAVTDMGNHQALRAQRVVFQLWKEDVPWAKRGEVTVALGGDIAKEAGILPDAGALAAALPGQPGGAAQAPVSSTSWARHDDPEKSFQYPAGWKPATEMAGGFAFNYYISPDRDAAIIYLAPFNMGPSFRLEDFLTQIGKSAAGGFDIGPRESTTIGGAPADLLWYESRSRTPFKGVAVAIKKGRNVYYFEVNSLKSKWPTYEQRLLESVRSYVAKGE